MNVFDFRAQPVLLRPDVTPDDAARTAADLWGITGEVRELGSNQDRNFLIRDGARSVLLKFSNPAFGDAELAAQNAAAAAVSAAGLRAPACIVSRGGAAIETVTVRGAELRVRVLEFVEGEPLTGAGPFTLTEARVLGALAARVALATAPLNEPGADQVTQWNLRIADDILERLVPQIPDAGRRAHVQALTDDALARLRPVQQQLRTQIIHGDLTDDNIVRGADGLIDGVIDFGDVAQSWTVAELAVTCASMLHHNPRSPLLVLETIAAFDELLPLTGRELDALWPLVQLRAGVLVASGEYQVALESDNAYADENRAQEWRAFVAASELDAGTMRGLIGWRLAGAASAPLPAPDRLLLDARAATLLDFTTTSPALDGGAWTEPPASNRASRRNRRRASPRGASRVSPARCRGPRARSPRCRSAST
jgi:Ser/Thr protein kinase RdoA (MazF antagonist)